MEAANELLVGWVLGNVCPVDVGGLTWYWLGSCGVQLAVGVLDGDGVVREEGGRSGGADRLSGRMWVVLRCAATRKIDLST